jgi:coenzyme F420-reducing hydrogenase delta subunit/Pyruvate/2-oxoacid:ferredoxin oxidoreductase delta subunit
MFYRDIYPVGKNGDRFVQSVMELDNVEPIRAIPTRMESNGGIELEVKEGGKSHQVPVDMLVLATALVPNEQTENIRTALDIDIDEDGFFRELNPTTAAVNTTDEGKFICGSCAGPKTISESISDGAAAAASLAKVLGQETIAHEIFVSRVDEDLCGGCGTCVKTCMFRASTINNDKHVSQIDIMRCKGCGNCVTACPSGARDLLLFPNAYFKEAVETLSKYDPPGPKILAMLCNGSAYGGADQAGLSGFKYPANVVSIRVPCAGRVNAQHVLYAFEKGFDGVLIGDCHHGNCHFIVGNTDMERRINLFREVLRSRRIDDDRLRIESMSANDGKKYADAVRKFVADLKKMEA